ncbi:MAG TPA: RNA polymerase sporulation sigma factor SigK [Desulfotomaculum sp.]|nr:RNA polymerase sporulation sigma factor SigK [Desulfotomaculum sp.]
MGGGIVLPGLWTLAVLSLVNGLLLLVSYIANNTFPQPLSEEEEKKCLDQLTKGSEEARNKLTEHNLRLVAHIVKKYDNTGEDLYDLISIGTIGLIKAINTFNPLKGTRLATYAARCIDNEILMHLRFIKKTRSEVSLYDPIGLDKEGNEITLIDVLGTHSEIVAETVENLFEKKRLMEIICKLNKREKNVLELRFGLGSGRHDTQREIAKKLGISRSYVSRIEKRALSKLTKEFNAEGCQ